MVEKKAHFSPLTQVAIEAARKAGNLLQSGFGGHFKTSSKSHMHDLVTEYDYKSEKCIIEWIRNQYPHSHFLAEESGETGANQKDLTWIIDPLDGTVNFAHNIPVFAVSIGVEKEGEIVSGVVFAPMLGEMFVAERGKGAFLNETPLGVSIVSELKGAMIATGFPYNIKDNPHHCIEHFTDLLHLGIPIRRLGAAAIDLAYVAAGRFDGYFEVALAPWDTAAGSLLVQEAGGNITHWDLKPFGVHHRAPLLATNGAIHPLLSDVLCRQR